MKRLLGWTHEQTIKSLLRKSGYYHQVDGKVLEKVQLTRYESQDYSMHYSEYARIRGLH